MTRVLLAAALALTSLAPASAVAGAQAKKPPNHPSFECRERPYPGAKWCPLAWRERAEARRARHREREARREAARRSSREAMWRRVASCECPSWTCDTGNGYQGGLQMDSTFQATYGSEFVRQYGGAHRWPVWAQMRAADRAYESRGLGPWPRCGLQRLGYRPVP